MLPEKSQDCVKKVSNAVRKVSQKVTIKANDFGNTSILCRIQAL